MKVGTDSCKAGASGKAHLSVVGVVLDDGVQAPNISHCNFAKKTIADKCIGLNRFLAFVGEVTLSGPLAENFTFCLKFVSLKEEAEERDKECLRCHGVKFGLGHWLSVKIEIDFYMEPYCPVIFEDQTDHW